MLVVDPHPYQDLAIDRGIERTNLLIAYGMGTGKTLIQLAICEELLGQDLVTLNAIVVPASLKWQWAQAIAWATDVSTREIRLKKQTITVPTEDMTVVIDGPPKRRKEQYRFVRENRPDYVILGYNNIINDWRDVRSMKPELICLDEATAIKTFSAERSKRVKLWRSDYRFALTGTPIDNRADELYSIMEWVDDTELGRYDLYERSFIRRDTSGRIVRYKNLDLLHKKAKNFMVRKTRFDPDVSPYMPKDYTRNFFVGISPKASALYREIAAELEEDLANLSGGGNFDIGAFYRGDGMGGTGSEEQGIVASKLLTLMMLTVDPRLLVLSAKKFDADLQAERPSLRGSRYLWQLWRDGRLEGLSGNPKLDAVVEQVKDALDENPQAKVIVFSFYKAVLEILREAIPAGSVVYNGDMNPAQKEEAKMQFKTDPETRVFLSSDAGGMGVDLPEANWLINFDPQWAAGKMDQRDSRHIRAGSNWEEVFILNYIVEDSVEEWKYEVFGLKRRIGSAILDGVGISPGEGEIENTVGSLRNWLASHVVN